MKRLLLMRHAKSAYPDGVTDHERPLNQRGTKAALKMAHLLLKKGLIPELVIVSSAKRTQQTWLQMNTVFTSNEVTMLMETQPDFYLSGLGTIQQTVSRYENHETMLLIGHNQGWSDAASRLSGRPLLLKTANIAVLEHASTNWTEAIHDLNWKLVDYATPKDCL